MYGRADISDPYDILKWMVEILEESEKKGEKVQILGHIPPGDDECLQAWSWNYYRIISRFGHIITGQFFGHIHKDYFVMYYDAETLTQPKSVAFVGPPGTPFRHNNIAYRIYEFDSTNFVIIIFLFSLSYFELFSPFLVLNQNLVDFKTYYADLEKSNAMDTTTKMVWDLEYSAKEAYGMADLSPQSWSDFMENMKTNMTLFEVYLKHFQVSVADLILEPCGYECRRTRLCESYQGFSNVNEDWCEHFYPKPAMPNNGAQCSSRFIKRP